MTSTTIPVPTQRRKGFGSPSGLFLAALVTAGLIVLAVWWGWGNSHAAQLPGTPASADAVAAQYGIRITHIAVLADGGLIDFRFQVVDPDKAAPLFVLETRPILISEATGQVVGSLYHPPHGHDIVPGQTEFFLYNNAYGALKRGMSVSVLLGTLRLEHIIAK